jgi:hypothetical protein
MMLFADVLPTSNYWEAVQGYFRKPGHVIQQVRRLNTQIKCRLVDGRKPYSDRFAKLRELLSSIDPNKLKENSDRPSLLYDFLVAAVNYYDEVHPHKALLGPSRDLISLTSISMDKHRPSAKHSLATSCTQDLSHSFKKLGRAQRGKSSSSLVKSFHSRETSPTFNEIHETSLEHRKNRSFVVHASSKVVFDSADPEVIAAYVKRAALDVNKLSVERRKAEWEEIRNRKAALAELKRKERNEEIERYRADSRKNWRQHSVTKLSKVKESREHNASVLEYRKLFRQQQQATVKDLASSEYGRSLVNRSSSRSPMRPLQADQSPDNQNRVKSRITELKHNYKQLQQRSVDERTALSMLRGESSRRLIARGKVGGPTRACL